MDTAKLPLKLKVGIRDYWNAPDCTKNQACEALATELGYNITLAPEWQMLLAELGQFYADKSLLASGLATAVECFCQAMLDLVNDDGGIVDEGWVNRMVDFFSHAQAVRLYVEFPHRGAGPGPKEIKLKRREDDHAVVFLIPREQIPGKSVLMPLFQGQLAQMFRREEEGEEDKREAEAEAEWTDVLGDRSHGGGLASAGPVAAAGAAAGRGAAAGAATKVIPDINYLPDPKTMLSPEELLSKPPYHLVVRDHGGSVTVECSHSPTLETLAGWFGKWSKVNHNDSRRPPQIKAELHPSSWGLSSRHERLTLSPTYSMWTASVTVVLALVEGSLGYVQTDVQGGTWIYRKDSEFKSLGLR